MKPLRWHKPKWLPRLLSMPVPEPSQQAGQILSFQRNIVLPVKLVFSIVIFSYLFVSRIDVSTTTPREVALEFLQSYFIFYLIFNAIAAALLVLKRFPHWLVPWVVFTVGLVDGVLLAGMTVETGGFGSLLFWVFPALIVVNALSIPLAAPQIVLNLCLCAFYLAAGVVNLNLGEPRPTDPLPSHQNWTLTKNDISDLQGLTLALRGSNALVQFLDSQLSPDTFNLLTNRNAETDTSLQQDLAQDLNHVIQHQLIYTKERFAGISISSNTLAQIAENHSKSDQFLRLNRLVLSEAFPGQISLPHKQGFLNDIQSPTDDSASDTPDPPEVFILRLIILLLLTVSCYGVQLLSFRQQLSDEEARKSAARNDELRAAGRLAAEIAHQLKNPLGIINNAAFSLTRTLKDGKNNSHLQLEIIREEIERSDRIITQLMGYAQLSEGRVEKLDLNEELERAVAEVFPPGTTYNVNVHRHYVANPPGLLMQRAHLSVVLVNVLQNAREALDAQGNIHIYSASREDASAEIIITDDGPGIPPDKLDKVFEAYYSSKEKGTGLGLAIVKHNVELYGGTVWADSELGKGARFVISFPAKTLIKSAK